MRIAYDQKTDTLSVILKEGVATLACLGGARHEKRHMDGVVFVDVGDHRTAGRGANIWPNWLSTTSNEASG